MESFYVYIHQRNDTGKCFYIGKGKGDRYKSKRSRNQHWKNIVNKVGFTPQILINGLTEDKSFELEKEIIKQVGIDNLVNMTEGGEGASGYKHSNEAKTKISKKRKGKSSWNKGINHSDDAKNKMSVIKKQKNSAVGEKNHFYGKKHSNDVKKKMSENHYKKTEIIIDDIIYYSQQYASKILKIAQSTIHKRLNSINFSNYQYI